MKLWNKIKSKFAKKEKDFNNYDVNDSDFIDPALRDQLPEFVIHDENLQWVMDNFHEWPSDSYQYVALIKKPDPVVGVKHSLKFFKRETNEGVASYSREEIEKLRNKGK